jgi:hypothetical protein
VPDQPVTGTGPRLPSGDHAWDDPATRWALRRHGRRATLRLLKVLSIYLGAFVILVVLTPTGLDGLIYPASLLTTLLYLFCAPMLVGRLVGLVATAMIWRRLIANSWRSYDCRSVRLGEGRVGVVTMTVREPGGGDRHLRFLANRRRETLRGIADDVWLAGDPRHRGVLTIAGGDELFLFHRDRGWDRAQLLAARQRQRRLSRPVKPPKPGKPAKVRQLTPEQRAKAAARVRAQAAAQQKSLARAAERAQKASRRRVKVRSATNMLPWRRRGGFPGSGSGDGGILKQ